MGTLQRYPFLLDTNFHWFHLGPPELHSLLNDSEANKVHQRNI